MTTYLVTGAAGLLGAEIAAALADRGAAVIGLVRKNRTLLRGDRKAVETSDWQGSRPGPGEIALVQGDVRDSRLGLSDEDFAKLARQVDCIVHCAAIVQFDAAPGEYRAVNIIGTRHLLDFAERASARGFVHVSTAYVCGESDGPVAEDAGDSPYCFANDYEASKFAAERLVRKAMAQGLSAAIARPSIVVGRETDGAIAGFDTIYMAFKLLSEGRIRTIPARPDASLNFVPLDHAVNGIVIIAERIDEARGKAFHLVASDPMPVPAFFSLIGDYPQFAHPELVTPASFDAGELSPLERRFHRRVASLYTSYFQRNPLFCEKNTTALLGHGGPAADSALLKRQIDFSIRAGFLKAESLHA